MLPSYEDIHELGRLAKRRVHWYDANGCPRFAPFHVGLLGVYDEVAILFRIECQNCRQSFHVGQGYSQMGLYRMGLHHADDAPNPRNPPTEELAKRFHYGDPPIHGCVGDTMNSVPRSVVEAWAKDGKHVEKDPLHPDSNFLIVIKFAEWTHHPELSALDLTPDWARS